MNVGRRAEAPRIAEPIFGTNCRGDQLDGLSTIPRNWLQIKEWRGRCTYPRRSFEACSFRRSANQSVHARAISRRETKPWRHVLEGHYGARLGPSRRFQRQRSAAVERRNPFAPEKGPDHNQRFGFNVGGALKENTSSFSINLNHSLQYTAPMLNVVTPGGGVRTETLRLRTPAESYNVALFVDYALTRDQTLRFGYYDNDNVRRNVGVGDYDALERAYTQKNGLRYYRIQHAGPIGRRIFINNRLFVGAFRNEAASAVEAPTIRVLDAWTSGGAQQRGSSAQRASSTPPNSTTSRHSFVAKRRAPHRGPPGLDDRNDYLAHLRFPIAKHTRQEASLYTRFIGDPRVRYSISKWARTCKMTFACRKG